jgi:hypothetical protein
MLLQVCVLQCSSFSLNFIADMMHGFGIVSRVTSVSDDFYDPESKQMNLIGTYMPNVEAKKSTARGRSDFGGCAVGRVVVGVVQTAMPPNSKPVGILLTDIYAARAVCSHRCCQTSNICTHPL